jgi:hypothetical protein
LTGIVDTITIASVALMQLELWSGRTSGAAHTMREPALSFSNGSIELP